MIPNHWKKIPGEILQAEGGEIQGDWVKDTLSHKGVDDCPGLLQQWVRLLLILFRQ